MSETLTSIRDLRIEIAPIKTLKPYDKNARTHSKKQIEQIANSILKFGWTNPILVDGQGGVIAGHGRLEAARRCCQSNANPSPAAFGVGALIQPEAGAILRGRRFSSI